jgi:hypothetical protein
VAGWRAKVLLNRREIAAAFRQAEWSVEGPRIVSSDALAR